MTTKPKKYKGVDPTALTDVGARIDELGRLRGFSRRKMAAALDRNPSSFNYTVSHSDIRASVAVDVASLLGTSVHWLLTGHHDERLLEVMRIARRECPDLARHIRAQLDYDEGRADRT